MGGTGECGNADVQKSPVGNLGSFEAVESSEQTEMIACRLLSEISAGSASADFSKEIRRLLLRLRHHDAASAYLRGEQITN